MPKLRSIFLLALLLHSISGHIVTKPSSHYSDILKLKCDALPCRSVYFDRNCYFVIDADGDVSSAAKKCSTLLSGSKLTQTTTTPADVWSSLFVDKNSFISDGDAKGKTKAMCTLENQFPPQSNLPSLIAGKTIRQEEQKLNAQMRLPFRLPFTKGVEVGQTIIIKGTYVSTDDYHFYICLQSGTGGVRETEAKGEDIPFAMSFNFNAKLVGWNVVIKGKWQSPEQITNPMKEGVPFDIRIRILEGSFQVFFDQKQLYVQMARLPYTLIKTLYIAGNGYVSYVKLGESYDPVPLSATLQQTAVSNTSISSTEPKELHEDKLSLYRSFALPVTEKMEPGRSFVIKGVVTPPVQGQKHEFFFFLQSGSQNWTMSESTGTVDIPFGLSFRFYEGKAVFNTMVKGNWHTKEERVPNPFKIGDPVDIRFNVAQYAYPASSHFLNDVGFQVLINQKTFYMYRARSSLDSIDHLMVYGSINLTQAYLVDDKYYPIPIDSSFATGFPMCYKQSCSVQRKWYTTRVLQADCKTLLISGVALEQSFSINLISKSGNIALKFNPRFDQKNVALNSYKDKKWLTEEVVNKLPFERNVPFEVAITNEANGFQIFVNGEHFVTYVHRVCPFDINLVDIEGVFDLNVQVK